jgi:hypothetical protein
MASSDMNKLALLYGEIESRLERGETSGPELERLFDEVSELTGTEVWANLDPSGAGYDARSSWSSRHDEAAPSSVG